MKYLPLLPFLLLISCDNDPEQHSNPGPDVFVAGVIHKGGISTAAFWKNDEKVELPGGAFGSYPNAIIVSGEDIFVAGIIVDENYSSTPVLWKNSELIRLPLPENFDINSWASITSLAIEGGDVYVGGFVTQMIGNGSAAFAPLIWKNGQLVQLENPFKNIVNSISISGEDVYAGANNGYWKNWVFRSLPDAGYVSSTKVVEGNIYNVGTIFGAPQSDNVAAYWKNNSIYPLPLVNNASMCRGELISVSGSDVHVAGYIYTGDGDASRVVGYWKNGVFVKVIGSPGSQATSMTIFEDDVYITGNVLVFEGNSPGYGAYWLDGKLVRVFESQVITSIFVRR